MIFERASIPGGAAGRYRMTWSTDDAAACEASAEPPLPGWSGEVALSGSVDVGPVEATTRARLTCTASDAGSTVRTLTLAPAKEVSLRFDISEPAVDPGMPVELSWSTQNADRCEAEGDWSGTRPVQGVETVATIDGDRSFTLRCSGPSGSAVDIRTVVVKAAKLSWSIPASSEDAAAGYNVYMGTASRDYDQSWEILDPQSTDFTVDGLDRGRTYFFAVTTISASGTESAFSNEGRKAIP